MQKQGPDKIEWCDYTWNPVTGCLHGCEYCYARKIAHRFRDKTKADKPYYVADFTADLGYKDDYAFPFGFRPTIHRYRLDEPQHIRKPSKIFVSSMADLFGDWVPDEWIRDVFAACERAPWHTYLFLTKNPARYEQLYDDRIFPYKENYWFGSTLTKPSDEYQYFDCTPYKDFVSIEPMLAPFGPLVGGHFPKWVIIGAMTGPGAKWHQPKRQWVADIVDQCHAARVPIFMKGSLARVWGEPLIQEWPEGMVQPVADWCIK